MKHLLIILISFLLLSSPVIGQETLNLKLTVHIMRDIEMKVQSESMTNDHISKANIANEVLPEVNRIWSQANINWELVGVYNENVVKKGYRQIPAGYPKNLWTYSGQTPDIYIGNLSHKKSWFDVYTNTFTDNLNRKILNKSYNYIERLVNGEDCGIPKYILKYDNYWEFGLCQESREICPTFHLDYSGCEDCIYCENCVYEGEVTLYWKSGFLGNEYIIL